MPTVDELRDSIREAVGRHARIESTAFTKEMLAALCGALNADIDTSPTPPKGAMRAAVLRAIDAPGADADDAGDGPFRKAELVAIADAVEVDES